MIAAVAVTLIARGLRDRQSQADLEPIPNQNVLLITIDTLRADALGCYGGPAATPALDLLAAEGVRFDFAHAHAVLTLPSHASILTGDYPFRHGVRENSGYRLAPNARTMATVLKRAGYATAAFVSAFPVHSRFGLNQGFDLYDDHFGETRAPTEFVMPERPAAVVVPLARQWIAAKTDRSGGSGGSGGARGPGGAAGAQPWFVWLHLFDPHAAYRPPPPFDAQYAGRPYYGEVAATDAALGPLLDDVRASGRPTLVVVTGDHGEALGDHGEETHGIFAYESTLRIPLIMADVGADPRVRLGTPARLPRWGPRPGADTWVGPYARPRAAGEVSSVAARHVDILPTILEAVGQQIPDDLPGHTLLPAAERRGATPRVSYFEAMAAALNRGWAPLTGVMADRDKYIDLPIPERYDLAADPGETSNLAGRSPDRDRTLLAALRSFGGSLSGPRRAENPDAAASLRALGYVSGSAPLKTRYTEADDPKALIALDKAVHRGVELYVERRYTEAVHVYQDIITRRPDMAIAYRHLAFVNWESGNVAAAVGTLRHALRAGVSNDEMTTQLGTYLAESGNAAEAVRLLEPLAKSAAPDIDALNGLGIAFARAGRQDEARRVFERILTLDPESALAHENLGTLDLDRGRLADAQLHFARAIHIDPSSSQAHAGLAVVAMKRGDARAAIDGWKKAVELDATNYDALYNLALTLARNASAAEARPYLERFVRTAPPAFYAKDIQAVSAILGKQKP